MVQVANIHWEEDHGQIWFSVVKMYDLFTSGTERTWFSVGSRSAFRTLRTVLSTGAEHTNLTLWRGHRQKRDIDLMDMMGIINKTGDVLSVKLLTRSPLIPMSPLKPGKPSSPWNETEKQVKMNLSVVWFDCYLKHLFISHQPSWDGLFSFISLGNIND